MIGLEVADDRFDGLASLEGAALVLGQGFELAPVNDLDVGVVLIDPTVAEVNIDRLGRRGDAFEQDGGLFELFVEGVSIIGIPGKGAGADDETVLMGDGQAGLDAKLVGFACFALADAFHFGSVQGVQLVLPLRQNSCRL